MCILVYGSWGKKDVAGNVIVYICHAVYTTVRWQVYKNQQPLKGSWKRETMGVGKEANVRYGNCLGPWRWRFIFNLNVQFFGIKIIFPFLLSPAKWISDYLDIKGCGANNEAMTHRSSLCQWRCGPNSQRESWTCGIFFLFWPRLLLRCEHSVHKLIDKL